jgi:hypothetical protein
MERSMGLEPTPGPWQGPVLPLYYDRPGTGKLYHDTYAPTRWYWRTENSMLPTGGTAPMVRQSLNRLKPCAEWFS